eukprot:gnl/TRDRNA2_/TRDRNA2_152637_c0_seq2.p1 gnl/TRDRNA2_/TRDRNA2_152637_c0~~gnl/TRDRNA2_/TRDRNA2_152637_c0_seq2.p1  ORF type:complete len:908 (-),score=191.79 gnl/TRDRNA2_/TRDRNA2_152637_c0_seq2:270-2993(-)
MLASNDRDVEAVAWGPSGYAPGTAVEYWSSKAQLWIPGRVQGWNEASQTYCLNVNDAASPHKIRSKGPQPLLEHMMNVNEDDDSLEKSEAEQGAQDPTRLRETPRESILDTPRTPEFNSSPPRLDCSHPGLSAAQLQPLTGVRCSLASKVWLSRVFGPRHRVLSLERGVLWIGLQPDVVDCAIALDGATVELSGANVRIVPRATGCKWISRSSSGGSCSSRNCPPMVTLHFAGYFQAQMWSQALLSESSGDVPGSVNEDSEVTRLKQKLAATAVMREKEWCFLEQHVLCLEEQQAELAMRHAYSEVRSGDLEKAISSWRSRHDAMERKHDEMEAVQQVATAFMQELKDLRCKHIALERAELQARESASFEIQLLELSAVTAQQEAAEVRCKAHRLELDEASLQQRLGVLKTQEQHSEEMTNSLEEQLAEAVQRADAADAAVAFRESEEAQRRGSVEEQLQAAVSRAEALAELRKTQEESSARIISSLIDDSKRANERLMLQEECSQEKMQSLEQQLAEATQHADELLALQEQASQHKTATFEVELAAALKRADHAVVKACLAAALQRGDAARAQEEASQQKMSVLEADTAEAMRRAGASLELEEQKTSSLDAAVQRAESSLAIEEQQKSTLERQLVALEEQRDIAVEQQVESANALQAWREESAQAAAERQKVKSARESITTLCVELSQKAAILERSVLLEDEDAEHVDSEESPQEHKQRHQQQHHLSPCPRPSPRSEQSGPVTPQTSSSTRSLHQPPSWSPVGDTHQEIRAWWQSRSATPPRVSGTVTHRLGSGPPSHDSATPSKATGVAAAAQAPSAADASTPAVGKSPAGDSEAATTRPPSTVPPPAGKSPAGDSEGEAAVSSAVSPSITNPMRFFWEALSPARSPAAPPVPYRTGQQESWATS